MTVTVPEDEATPAPGAVGRWRSVVDRFEQAAAAHPQRPALVYDGTTLSFGELAAMSAEVAADLAGRGVGAESLVGLLLPRGMEFVIGLLGTLRCGAGYIPLDPSLPEGRLRYIYEHCHPAFTLCEPGGHRVPPAAGGRWLTVAASPPPAARPAPRASVAPGQRAYVMYTSGSTGNPKAVEITHGSLTALLDSLALVAKPGEARVGWNASPSFDASVQQWLRLCRGDTMVLCSDQSRRDPQALASLVTQERLDELDITPSHLVSLLDYLPQRGDRPLRLLIGGEAIPAGLWSRLGELRAAGRVLPVNLYGPTECTVDATCAQIDQASRPHLGDPLPGTRLYLLDEALRPAATGDAGELYLAGTGVARGYLGMPGLTAQRFVADTVAGDGGRMYRTGDRARIGPEGRLEFLGRGDDQVKLRGYRIELGEIESVLSRCPGVLQAVAAVRDDASGGTLVAYCRTAAADGRSPEFDAEAVRRAAAQRLPDYMMPAMLIAVEQFPLSGNGKVDRRGLSDLPWPQRAAGHQTRPRTGTETLIAAAWGELLGVGQVGPDDNFFDLGGQSLLAIRLVALLRRQVSAAIPLVAVFRYPVLRELATYLDREWPCAAPNGT